jgi:hypothetical protein
MLDADYRDLGPPQPPQGEDAAMSGQDLVVAVDQDRDKAAEGFNAFCDLAYLASAMLFGFRGSSLSSLIANHSIRRFRAVSLSMSRLLTECPAGRRSALNATRSRKPVSAISEFSWRATAGPSSRIWEWP